MSEHRGEKSWKSEFSGESRELMLAPGCRAECWCIVDCMRDLPSNSGW